MVRPTLTLTISQSKSNNERNAMKRDMTDDAEESIADEARGLLDATANTAGEKIAEARRRLGAVLDTAKEKAIDAAKSTDRMVRDHPYESVGIAFVVGALVGFLLSRRN